jgi:hypothetical protein
MIAVLPEGVEILSRFPLIRPLPEGQICTMNYVQIEQLRSKIRFSDR